MILAWRVVWHLDDLKSSAKDPKVKNEFVKWSNKEHGKEKEAKVARGKKRVCLGLVLDHTSPGEVKIDMKECVTSKFPQESPGKTTNPNNDKLFKVKESKQLDQLKKEAFHTFVVKALFLTKRARPDMSPTMAFRRTRVDRSACQDWTKSVRLMDFSKKTKDNCLTSRADNSHHVMWSIDAAFVAHQDVKSHSGAVMTVGRGAAQSMSKKQKLNTRSSAESELAAVDDGMSHVLRTKNFLEAQGHKAKHFVNQDNKSTIELEQNGPKSAGKRSRHTNMQFFFIANQIKKGNTEARHCPTDEMEGDHMTKPPQGNKFHEFQNFFMNLRN